MAEKPAKKEKLLLPGPKPADPAKGTETKGKEKKENGAEKAGNKKKATAKKRAKARRKEKKSRGKAGAKKSARKGKTSRKQGKAKKAKRTKQGKPGRKRRKTRAGAKAPAPKGFFEQHSPQVNMDLTDLKTVKNIYDWLDFLTRKLGVTGARGMLKYYENIRAISPPFRKILEQYITGMTVPKKQRKKGLSQREHEESLEMLNGIFTEAKRR